ncbi:lachesin-like isoform X3 [Spodoptera litura]|uniref:Hemolin n=1 Tax=Spodoptera litura TaxID=69820 RepID=A0A9J7EDS5_SPOLT|nr:lachesin-like isoform X3 [Spodoptera litura]
MMLLYRLCLWKSGRMLLALFLLDWLFAASTVATTHEPGFSAPIANVTAPLGREAILACTVHNLSTYKVAWLRVDTQTILTIHTHVISRSRRVGVTHSDHRTWFLHIRELRETDRGWYMCQINTDPMKSQLGYLDIVVTSFEGPELNITRVTRQHAGAYLCIASNGVPPTVSKRIMLTVQFPPVITIRNQLVGAALGTELVLECETEAYPKPVSYWSRDNGEIVPVGGGLEPHKIDGSYRSVLKLAIRRVTSSDYGTYKCVSKNSLGDTEGTIKLYPMPLPPMENKNVVQRLNIVADKSSESTPFGTQDFRLQDYNRASKYQCCHFLFLLIFFILITLSRG